MNHLQPEERHTIQKMNQQGHSKKIIAAAIKRSPSTISRELKRNALGDGDYSALFAERKALERAQEKARYQGVNPENLMIIEAGLKEKLSPEQIIGSADANESQIKLPSIATIYKHIHAERASGGKLYRNLRHQGRRRKKHGQGKVKQTTIRNRKDISQRAAEVEKRKRRGDLECDLVIGAKQSGAMLTVNCRASGKVWIRKLASKESRGVRDALIEVLQGMCCKLHTITSDNGKEFALHEEVSAATNCEYYFARPYHSWERGSNENTNGLIRQYFPKGMEFGTITEEEVKKVEEALNNRPRKRYNFLSPNQKYEQIL